MKPSLGKFSKNIMSKYFDNTKLASDFFKKWETRIQTAGAIIIVMITAYECAIAAQEGDYVGVTLIGASGAMQALSLIAQANDISILIKGYPIKVAPLLVAVATAFIDTYYAIKMSEANSPQLKEAYACKIATATTGAALYIVIAYSVPTCGLALVAYAALEISTWVVTAILAHFGILVSRAYTFSEGIVALMYWIYTGKEMPDLNDVQKTINEKAKKSLDTWQQRHFEDDEMCLIVKMKRDTDPVDVEDIIRTEGRTIAYGRIC